MTPANHQVLLVSDGWIHPSFLGRLWLRRALGALPTFHFRRLSSLNRLATANLDGVCGLVLYYHHKRLAPLALERLQRFVHEGGGVLALHAATASFKEEAAYFELLGGRFTHHGPIQPVTVQPARGVSTVFDPIAPFTVRDELYRHDWDESVELHFVTTIDGEQEPIVWTRHAGCGRVAYCSLGHRAATLRHPAVQAILRQALLWICS